MNYLVCFLLFFSRDTCHEKFLNEILKTPVEKEYFLVIKVKDKSKVVDMVLTNVDLEFELKNRGIKFDYEIKKKILSNEIVLKANDGTKCFGIVRHIKKVNEIQKKGESYFINYYFDNKGNLKDNTKGSSIEQIIEILFNWNVFVSYPEGNLHIDRRLICNQQKR